MTPNSQSQLVKHLVDFHVLTRNSCAYTAMLQTDRAMYCPAGTIDPYGDHPESLGHFQTVSAPHMHALSLDLLSPAIETAANSGIVRILDVGSGSGYLTAALARTAEAAGASDIKVTGLERIEALAQSSLQNIENDDPNLLNMIQIVVGDGWHGWSENAPYDAIHVGAAAETFPTILGEQLAEGGTMVVPVGGSGNQSFSRCQKVNGKINCEEITEVDYVPLIRGD